MKRRHAVVLPALCWSRRRRDFYAVTADVSTDGIRFRSSARLSPGEDLTCSVRHIGVLEARIVGASGQEFVVRAARGQRSDLSDLARRFLVLARAQTACAEPVRAHRRIVPAQKAVRITLEEGLSVPGQVLDVSASGAALIVDRPLRIGAPLLVGTRPAKVTRHLEGGVGVAFVEPLDPGAVHAAMTL